MHCDAEVHYYGPKTSVLGQIMAILIRTVVRIVSVRVCVCVERSE